MTHRTSPYKSVIDKFQCKRGDMNVRLRCLQIIVRQVIVVRIYTQVKKQRYIEMKYL